MEKEITDYITQAQKHGLSDFEIKQNLLNAGWEAAAVEDSFVFAKANESRPQTYKTEPVNLPPPAQNAPGPASFQSPHANVAISEQHFAQPPKTGRHSRGLVFGIIFGVLLLAAGGAYAYYVKIYNTPERVWNKFSSSQGQTVFTSTYALSYGFNSGQASSTAASLGINGTSYTDRQDPKNAKASNNVSVNLKSGPTAFSFSFSYLILNKILYVDLSKIEQLKEFVGESGLSWVKFDFDEIKNYAKEEGKPIDTKNPFDIKNNLSEIILSKWGAIFKPGKFLAKEDLNGTPVYHLKNEFDAQAFSQILIEALNKNLVGSQNAQKQLTADEKNIITAVINKVKVKELDSWIGQKDYQLYKIHLVLSAPSPSDLTDSSSQLYGSATKNRDAQRLADVRQVANALELYYNDKGSYPQESKNGQPVGLVSTFIGKWPVAPMPADGKCTDYYNTYWYEPAQNGKDYNLTFCLGGDTGGYKAGIAKFTASGLQSNITCPSSVSANCVNPSPAPTENLGIQNQIKKLKFDAEVKLDVTYSDFGKAQNLPPPVSPTDILDLVKKALDGEVKTSTSTPPVPTE